MYENVDHVAHKMQFWYGSSFITVKCLLACPLNQIKYINET